MRDDLGNLARFDGIIQPNVEIVGHIDRLVAPVDTLMFLLHFTIGENAD
jgi:hypothetical protein